MAKIIWLDRDGYANKETMFANWLKEWSGVGFQMGGLKEWYRSEMDRQVQPDLEVNEFLAQLTEPLTHRPRPAQAVPIRGRPAGQNTTQQVFTSWKRLRRERRHASIGKSPLV